MKKRLRRHAMTRVCLIGCAQQKLDRKARASDLYISDLFRKARAFAEKRFDRWYILSAKYGLLVPTRKVTPYDITLNRMPRDERRRWARRVFRRARARLRPGTTITVLAGVRYREALVPLLRMAGYRVRIPLEGRTIGFQKQWLKMQNEARRFG